MIKSYLLVSTGDITQATNVFKGLKTHKLMKVSAIVIENCEATESLRFLISHTKRLHIIKTAFMCMNFSLLRFITYLFFSSGVYSDEKHSWCSIRPSATVLLHT